MEYSQLVCRTTNALGASVFLREEGRLRLRGTTGILGAERENVWYRLGEGKTGWVAEHGIPIRLVDRDRLDEWKTYNGCSELHSTSR